MKNLGKEIRKRRLKLGLTQKKVEELLGVGVGSYQRIECGRRSIPKMSFETGLQLCAILGVDPYELLIGMTRESYGAQVLKGKTEKKI